MGLRPHLFLSSVVSRDQGWEEARKGETGVSSRPAGGLLETLSLWDMALLLGRVPEPLVIFPACDCSSPSPAPAPSPLLLRCPGTSPEAAWCPGAARELSTRGLSRTRVWKEAHSLHILLMVATAGRWVLGLNLMPGPPGPPEA